MSNGTLNQNLLTYIFSKIKAWAFPKSGGTITGNVTLDSSATKQSGEPSLSWGTVGGNKPYVGFAHDQVDGTFIICSMEKNIPSDQVKNYKNGLAIGGGSGNLFWKGTKIATTADITLDSLGVTASSAELNYTDGVTSNIQTQLNAKAPIASPTFTGSISLGRKSTIGESSFAVGKNVEASGTYSHAEGEGTSARNSCSHAEGYNTMVTGNHSHAEGQGTTAASYCQHVEGSYNVSDYDAKYLHIVGNGTFMSPSNAHTLDWEGNAWFKGDVYVGATGNAGKDPGSKKLVSTDDLSAYVHADSPTFSNSISMGRSLNTTIGSNSVAIGSDVYACEEGSFACGINTSAVGAGAHAEGDWARAEGAASHAEGSNTTAVGNYSHAEGELSQSIGIGSHAEGVMAFAVGNYSHAEGEYVQAKCYLQHVQGIGNIPDENGDATTKGTYAHIVGNGTLMSPSNAHTLDWEGNAWFAGDVYVGSTSGTNKDSGSVKLAKAPKVVSVSLSAASWNSTALTQSVTVSGVTTSNLVTVGPVPASIKAAAEAGVYCSAQAANSLTFTCTAKPTVNLSYTVVIQEV